jgi:hypothetical protein
LDQIQNIKKALLAREAHMYPNAGVEKDNGQAHPCASRASQGRRGKIRQVRRCKIPQAERRRGYSAHSRHGGTGRWRDPVPATSCLGPYRKMNISLHQGQGVQWHSLTCVLPDLQEANTQRPAGAGTGQGTVPAMFPTFGQQQMLATR